MRNIQYSLLIIISLCISCNNSKLTNSEPSVIWTDSITNQLIRSAIDKNKYQCDLFVDKAPLYYSDTNDLINLIINNTEFTATDTSFIRKQLEFNRKYEFKIDTANYSAIIFMSYDTLNSWGLGTKKTAEFWTKYRSEVHRCFCIIFCPIFNHDKSLAVMTSSHLCGGTWIESYDIYYKRINQDWIPIDTISQGGS